MDENLIAFADESGNNSFNFREQGSHFIVATVIAKKGNLDKIKRGIDEIRKKHKFQTGEIKSSGVAGNYKRRIAILQDLVKLDIFVYAIVVDKTKLSGEGFQFKKSFYKFLNNLLYRELFRTFPDIDLYVDEHGANDYMVEFKKYVEKNHPKNLFYGYEFNILDSKKSEFIQLADFIAGTLNYIYDENKKSEYSKEFEDILMPIISGITFFPRINVLEDYIQTNIDEDFDKKIAEVSYIRAIDFLEKEKIDNQQKIDQANFLKLLLLLQRVYPKNKFTTTTELMRHMNQGREEELKEEYFRTKVVGNLRDRGILIASSRTGYKIPTTEKDLNSFINHGKRIILPMLNRINEARKAIKFATGNDLDILQKPEFDELKKLLD
ncbi:DUF3800 domain-containing protein [Chryseobacterium indologenes]|uniref:DUF3800 domain-containing protein n=1 Tax=Chryseobacterium indologenes TaxID=253 RepID=UPI002D7EA01B|nr:DUF3800 domain-containing protein [Chryseobacterium indologenes]MEB4760187.1 DUF3800 domain-containing protein [Chryseobacterium indologenes]